MIPGTCRPIVSAKALCLIAGFCMVAAWFFIPDPQELVSRLDKDGHVERLKALAEEALAEEVKPTAPQTDAERMKDWIHMADAEARENPAVIAEKKIMCAITETPAAVGLEVVVGAKRIDSDLFGEFMDALSRRALGLQRQAEAGMLLGQWNQQQPSWDLTMRAVQAWRWAVKSGDALKALDSALASGLDPKEAPQDVEELRLKLALESNQVNLAFDIKAKQYARASKAQRPEVLHRLLELANAGDRTPEATRLVTEHLSTIRFQVQPLDQAIQAVAEGTPFASPEEETGYREYGMSLAHWQEWAGHGDAAIETWFRLSLIGSEEGWARVLDLYEDVLRTDDFIKVLAFRISKGVSLDKQMLLASLLVDQGRIEDAIKHYQAAVPRLADAALAHRALARIYQQQGEWQMAMDSFAKVLVSWPTDAEASRGRAFSLVRLNRYEEACDAYVNLAKALPNDAELQEICAGLCDSLGRSNESREATQRLLICAGRESTPEEHMELADEFRVAGDVEATVSALKIGFARHPASLRLRLTLAEALSHKGDHNGAVTLLAHESLRSDPGAMDLLISEAVEATNGTVALSFIGSEPPACLRDLPVTRLRLAFLLDRVGQKQAADRLMALLVNDKSYYQSELSLEMGRLCLSIGDEINAETFVRHYVSSTPGNNPKAWELLGDIYQSLERNDDALAAYRKAVEVIGEPTVPKTESKPADPADVKVSQNDATGQ